MKNMYGTWQWKLRISIIAVGGLLASGIAWGAEQTRYQQVLDTIEQLTPHDHIQLDMAVEPTRYTEKYCVTDASLSELLQNGVPVLLVDKLASLKDQHFPAQQAFLQTVETLLETTAYSERVLKAAAYTDNEVGYLSGERFELRFQASQESYIALMYITELRTDNSTGLSSGGEITFLLPNQAVPETRIQAEQVYSTVQDFHLNLWISGPSTIDVVNLFCSPTPLDWLGSDLGQTPYSVIHPTDDDRLQHILTVLAQMEHTQWTGDSLILNVGGGSDRAVRKFGAIPPIGVTGTTGKEATEGDERNEGSRKNLRIKKLWGIPSR